MTALTLSSLMPYLLAAGVYVLGHFQVVTKLLSTLGIVLGGAHPLIPASPGADSPLSPRVPVLVTHPILSDAVSAAITKAAHDATTGQITSLRAELAAIAAAAASAAVADLKAKL